VAGRLHREEAVKPIKQIRIWVCACGQKNRVDITKVFGTAARPICGKCKAPLHYEAS
jgi:hypothetical protein